MTDTPWECACWRLQSFVICDKEDGIPRSGNGVDLSSALVIEEETKRALCIKELFIAAAQERLPIMVGPKYGNVVVSCLSCRDKDNQGFGDESEFQDSDGVVIGVKYIERVLHELQQIAV
jgi:hypothetical protein